MAFKSCYILAILILLPNTIVANEDDINIDLISKALQDKGDYITSSIMMGLILPDLVASDTTRSGSFTIFCPIDRVYTYTPTYDTQSFTQHQYQTVPKKLDRQALESLKLRSKIDTLIPGHPLVVTGVLSRGDQVTINHVGIRDWEIYKDEHIIIHGVDQLFNPSVQVIHYPEYNDVIDVRRQQGRLEKPTYGVESAILDMFRI